MDGTLILEFRVYDTGTSAYAWSRSWTDRLLSPEPLSFKIDASDSAFGGFYPELTRLKVRNDDRFWDRLERTAPQLAAGSDPYRSGFRGRLVRIIESSSGTERVLFTGAVDDLSISSLTAATISVIGLQRLAMEQKADAEEIDDKTASGDWETEPTALYRSRTSIGNGGYDIECFRHKRAKSCFERTKMPRMDAGITAENVKISTFDDRRTVSVVSLPEGLDWNGFVWGNPSAAVAYATARDVSANKFYLYRWDYETGEVTLLSTLDATAYHRVAICGLLYNGDQGDAGQIAIPTWKHTGTGRWEVPWLFVYDIDTDTFEDTDLQAWCTATLPATGGSGATKSFDEFFFWAPARRAASSAGLWGTLWFIVDTRKDNRVVEVSPWGSSPSLLNDSLAYYTPGTHGVPAGTAFWPAACAEYAAADPTATPALAGACVLYCYACTQDYYGVGGYHDLLLKLTLGGSSTWSAASTVDSDTVGHALAICGCVVETTVGLVYSRQGTVNDTIVSRRFADFGVLGAEFLREAESYVGMDGYFYDFDGRYGPQFVMNYVDDRIYFGTGNVNDPDNWNMRLRSIDSTYVSGPGAGARDENTNPYVAGGVGDPPTDQCSGFQNGCCLLVRYNPTTPADWELHGILVSTLEPDVVMSYSKTYYPCLPLFDVRAKSLWDIRKLLAAACQCYFAYDGNGNVRMFPRVSTAVAGMTWPREEPDVTMSGMRNVVNRLSAIPYRASTSSETREAEVIQQNVLRPTSTGMVLNIKCGRVTATATYRIRFTSATAYVVEKLSAGTWSAVGAGTGSRTTTFTESDDFTLSPDCFAGRFVAGDTFTFCVYAQMGVLERMQDYSKVEVADTSSETKYGRTEASIDNPFVTRAHLIDLLVSVLEWTSEPHRMFALHVVPYMYTYELELRTLTVAGDSVSAALVGWKRTFGAKALKELTLVEV